MDPKAPIFDFGDLRPEDVARVARELDKRGFQKLEIPAETLEGASDIARAFCSFVREGLLHLGLIDRAGKSRARLGVEAEVPNDLRGAAFQEYLWNLRAEDWAAVESPLTYAITVETLLEHFQFDRRRKRQVFLSLGSGPGLYETFLAGLFAQALPERRVRFLCVDVAAEMTRMHRKILGMLRTPEGQPIRNVEPITDDMTHLWLDAGTVDQILCNNSLQWVEDWPTAIREMARVIRPEGLRRLYLFVHLHPMVARTSDGRTLHRSGDFTIPELLDELERCRFRPLHLRQIAGAKGSGQAGGGIQRVFVLAEHITAGAFPSWREATISSALRVLQAAPSPARDQQT